MDLTEFGWRTLMMLAVVAAGAYLLVSLLRLIGLRRRRRRPSTLPDTQIPTGVPDSPPAVGVPAFAEQLGWTRLDTEVRELRAELVAIRAELSELRAARRVSPLYADAAALARRGYDAQGVAEECGISVAEAELVLSMSRGGKNLDDEADDGRRGPVESSGR